MISNNYALQIKELQVLKNRILYRLKSGKAFTYIHVGTEPVYVSWFTVADIEIRIKQLSGSGFVMYKK